MDAGVVHEITDSGQQVMWRKGKLAASLAELCGGPIPLVSRSDTASRKLSWLQHHIIRVALLRPRASKHRDDLFFVHRLLPHSSRLFLLCFAFRSGHVELLEHRHAQPRQRVRRFVASPALIIAQNEKISRRPLGVSANPESVLTCSTDPVFACIRPTAGVFFMRSSSVPSTPATGNDP